MSAPNHIEAVRGVAGALNLLDDRGNLIDLDSISVIDMIIEIEKSIGILIPVANLQPQSFESIESIAALIFGEGRRAE